MKITARQMALGGIFLAVCIASQFFKNISPYITGSIINFVLIMATHFVGLSVGIIIGLITPITSFFITGSPAYPIFLFGIMAGNLTLVILTGIIGMNTPGRGRLTFSLIAGVLGKFFVMWWLFTYTLIPFVANGIPEAKREAMVKTLSFNFSILQLITATIGAFVAFGAYNAVRAVVGKFAKPKEDESSKASGDEPEVVFEAEVVEPEGPTEVESGVYEDVPATGIPGNKEDSKE